MAIVESTNAQRGFLQFLARLLRPPGKLASAPRLSPLEFSVAGHPFDPFTFRSEDVRFSPSGRLIAVATTQRKILLFAVDPIARPIQTEFLTALSSPDLNSPHGVDWIDEETLVVANRGGPGLAFFRVPRANQWKPETEVAAASTVASKWFGAVGETRALRTRNILTGPGSARIHDAYIYAGCNKSNTVTRHRILSGLRCDEGELVAQEGIEIPDSAAVSPNGAWLAVGDHDHHRVLMFRLGETSPGAQLTDPSLTHPHGVAFDPSGTLLVAADAGGRGLFVFQAPDGEWDRDQTHASSQAEGVDKTVFDRVQAETAEPVRALEGGAKGVDVSKDGRIVVTTCRGQTLRFFELHAAS